MESLIFVIIIAFFIVASKGKSAGKNEKKRRAAQSEAVDAQINKGVSSVQHSKAASLFTPMNSSVNRPSLPMSQNGQSSGYGKTSHQTNRSVNSAKPREAAPSADPMSTTEMLAKKAADDQKEHMREQFEQKQHEKKYYSGYNYARRYMLGDPVSPTDKIIYCPNCAAENLVKIHENPRKYHCYFCRANLAGEE